MVKLDGHTWSELGGLNGLAANSSINKICVDKQGNVYATGFFTEVVNFSTKCYVAVYN